MSGEPLYAALAGFRAAIEPLSFDGKNPHFKSRYATLGNVINTLKVHLPAHGLTWFQTVDMEDGSLVVRTTVVQVESGDCFTGVFLVPKNDNIQKTCAAISYARRYGLVTAFGLHADDDDDGNNAVGGRSMKSMAAEFKRLVAGDDPDEVTEKLMTLGVEDFRDLDESVAEAVLRKIRQSKSDVDVDLGGER